MALTSPGVEVSIVDESFYTPGLTASVPLVVLATGQDKASGSGTGTAAGTTAATAGDVYLLTSQRELTSTFGNPTFYQSSNGSALNGYELNEYGLMAAYSVLGVSNRCYVVRADIDLSELVGTSTRPTGFPANNTYWFDTGSSSLWGVFEFNQSTGVFTNKVPTMSAGVPASSTGAVGDYAVNTSSTSNTLYYKGSDNAWVQLGTQAWQLIIPTVQTGTFTATAGTEDFSINGYTVSLTSTTLAQAVIDINNAGIPGVNAAADSTGTKLELFADTDANAIGDSSVGIDSIALVDGTGTPLVSNFGMTAAEASATYLAPDFLQQGHTSVPAWKSGETVSLVTGAGPRPTGSVWVKTTTPNSGADLLISKFSTSTNTWSTVDAPLYENDRTADYNLDVSGGGTNIAAGVLYTQYDVTENDTGTYKFFKRYATGAMSVTGSVTTAAVTSGHSFTLSESAPGSTAMSATSTITLTDTTHEDMATQINAANMTYVSASVETTGALTITHSAGGMIIGVDTGGDTALADAGFTAALSSGQVRAGNNSDIILSNWVPLTYTASSTAPSQNPDDLTYWYDSSTDVDIMINDGSNWVGYQNETLDARGFNLSTTDDTGVIVSASEPTTQVDETALVDGDIWIDSSDLENYPVLYRRETVNSEATWVAIDKTDQTTENGILFADARYIGDTTTDVVTGTVATTASLLTDDDTDIDAPNPALYPRGMLLFNTRRSGGTVKQFRSSYFTRTNFASVTDYPTLPTETDAWVTASGNKADGSPYMMRTAQRKVVVAALQAVIDSNTDIREEQREFNLIAAPGYPELIDNMVTLNNDRNTTAFIIGDSPMRLANDSTSLTNWATNTASAEMGEDGLTVNDAYLGVFYPSGSTNDLSGNTIVVPPSHAMLRTIIRSDDKSWPWLAPAGTQRGNIDNLSALGYVNATSGEFVSFNVSEGVRDTLYENAINPLTFIPGTGLVNYGNKTRHSTTSALDRINVARLMVYVRKQLGDLSKPFVFEPNDKITRDELKQQVEQLCNDLVAKRGLYDYLVICDETNNTATRIDRNELYVDVAIEPVKAAEFIYIPIRIKNTGEISGGNASTSGNG